MRYINLRFTYLLTYLNFSTGIKTRLTKLKQKTSLIDQLCEVGEDVRSKDGVSRPLFCVFVICCGGETTGRRSIVSTRVEWSTSGWEDEVINGLLSPGTPRTIHTQISVDRWRDCTPRTIHTQISTDRWRDCTPRTIHTQISTDRWRDCTPRTIHTQISTDRWRDCTPRTIHTQISTDRWRDCTPRTIHTQISTDRWRDCTAGTT